MSEKKISYLNRDFESYREALVDYVGRYYPHLADKFDDASIGSWIIDVISAMGDNLSYHTDRVFNETNINSANERSSIMNIARSNGLKVPGPKASIASETFSCILPVISEIRNDGSTTWTPNMAYAPVIKRGTQLTSGSQFFEVMSDIDFSEQFNEEGYSDRNIFPQKDSNGKIRGYLVEKYAPVYAGQTRVYRQVLTSSDVKPFMEIVLPDKDIMSIESIIFKDGVSFNSDPSMSEFMNPNEYVPASESPTSCDTYRYFEVDSLVDQYRWGDDVTSTRYVSNNIGQPVTYTYGYYNNVKDTVVPTFSVTKGEWIPLTQKFITEYTDNGYLKIIFGCGEDAGQIVSYNEGDNFSRSQISKMIRNNFMGKLPRQGWTMYVQYRIGGGASSNVPKGRINTFSYLNMTIGKCLGSSKDSSIMSTIRSTMTCTNTTPSVSGKDAPSVEEIKNMVKYNNGSQNRCVTLKDYVNRVHMMPSRYGCPFRVGAIESNNKVMMYLLGVDSDGKLSSMLPDQLITNIENYLSKYRSINDFVEIKSGRIVNVSFEVDLYVDKNYNANDVILNVMNTIKGYIDINKFQLGDDIYVSDLVKEISMTDGVLNVIDLRVYNEYGEGYSMTRCTQSIKDDGETMKENKRDEIDLDMSDYILTSDSDEMFEIKYPEKDIKLRVKVR